MSIQLCLLLAKDSKFFENWWRVTISFSLWIVLCDQRSIFHLKLHCGMYSTDIYMGVEPLSSVVDGKHSSFHVKKAIVNEWLSWLLLIEEMLSKDSSDAKVCTFKASSIVQRLLSFLIIDLTKIARFPVTTVHIRRGENGVDNSHPIRCYIRKNLLGVLF